jgi:uroporphyrinogen-III synthase
MVSVLITRPLAASEALAAELKREKYEPVIEPLLEIVPLAEPLPDVNVQAVMITSPNSLDALAGNPHVSRLFHLPCFCVGARTAAKAKEFGFLHVSHSSNDGRELAQLVVSSLTHNCRVILHICGRDVASTAQEELHKSSYQVTRWFVYTARKAVDFTPDTLKRFEKKKLDAVLVFSTRTADALAVLMTKHHLTGACKKMAAIGLSEAATGPLKPFSWQVLAHADMPSEDAMMECLKRICPPK